MQFSETIIWVKTTVLINVSCLWLW